MNDTSKIDRSLDSEQAHEEIIDHLETIYLNSSLL